MGSPPYSVRESVTSPPSLAPSLPPSSQSPAVSLEEHRQLEAKLASVERILASHAEHQQRQRQHAAHLDLQLSAFVKTAAARGAIVDATPVERAAKAPSDAARLGAAGCAAAARTTHVPPDAPAGAMGGRRTQPASSSGAPADARQKTARARCAEALRQLERMEEQQEHLWHKWLKPGGGASAGVASAGVASADGSLSPEPSSEEEAQPARGAPRRAVVLPTRYALPPLESKRDFEVELRRAGSTPWTLLEELSEGILERVLSGAAEELAEAAERCVDKVCEKELL